MLFIVPDTDLDKNEEEQSPSSPSASGKVELDLDDAPFLQDAAEPEKPTEEAEIPPEASPPEDSPEKKVSTSSLFSNKWFLVSLALFFILLGGSSWFLMTKQPPPPPPEPKPVEEVPKEPEEILVSLEPFLIEQQSKGKIRFLQCKFSLPTKNPKVEAEIRIKSIVIRDAMFYYLKNKETTFLADEKNVSVLKKDLLGVVNQYLSSGQIQDILVEEYVLR